MVEDPGFDRSGTLSDMLPSSLGGSRLACIATDGMARARRLVEALAGAVDSPGSVIHLGLDFAREDVAEDESGLGMDMRRRCPARRVVDNQGDD